MGGSVFVAPSFSVLEISMIISTVIRQNCSPITGQPLKAMAIPVDASILRRVRSELGNGVEYRIGVFTKITSASTAESTQVLGQGTPIAGYRIIWFHVLGLSDQENSAEQRFEHHTLGGQHGTWPS